MLPAYFLFDFPVNVEAPWNGSIGQLALAFALFRLIFAEIPASPAHKSPAYPTPKKSFSTATSLSLVSMPGYGDILAYDYCSHS